MNIEVEQALEQLRVGRTRVIPVIVRPEASWKDFAFGKITALPTDAKPVTKWANVDEAWECVASGVRKVIESMTLPQHVGHVDKIIPHMNYVEELDAVEGPLVHPRVRKVLLQDIFVYPDLEMIDSSATGKLIRSSEKLLEDRGVTVIIGERQSGKSTLLKRLAVDQLRSNEKALYVDLRGQNLENLLEIVRRAAATKLALALTFSAEPPQLSLIALDNFDLGKNVDAAFDRLNKVLNLSKRIYISVSNETVFSPDFKSQNLRDVTSYMLGRFSVNKRRQIIEKWVSLGSTNPTPMRDAEVERREEEMNAILRRNVVPSLPALVLLVLQGLESSQTGKSELTSYGHCYNLMIVSALRQAGVKSTDLDAYVNILTELSYAMHVLGVRALPTHEVDVLLDAYKKVYLAPPRHEIVATLLDSCLMQRSNGDLLVARYVSGYFAGKHIADNLGSNETILARLNFLANNAHNDDCALVLLFVCHHTKTPAVLETILLNLMVSLDTHKPSLLAPSDFADLARALSELPKTVLKIESVSLSRMKAGDAHESANFAATEVDDMSAMLDAADDVARLLRAIKALEISGQLVRNRSGSLPIPVLTEFIREAVSCAQRVAGFIIEQTNVVANAVPELLIDIRAENSAVSSNDLERDLRAFLVFNSHFALHGLFRLVSQNLSNEVLSPLVLSIIADRTDAFSLLLQAHLSLKAADPSVIADLRILLPKFDKNPFAMGLLRRAVADRLQLFNIDIRDKQRIAEMFNIPVATQVARNRNVLAPHRR